METINKAFKLISVWMLTVLFVFLGFAVLTFIIANLSGYTCVLIMQKGIVAYLLIGIIIANVTTYYYSKELGITLNLNPE